MQIQVADLQLLIAHAAHSSNQHAAQCRSVKLGLPTGVCTAYLRLIGKVTCFCWQQALLWHVISVCLRMRRQCNAI